MDIQHLLTPHQSLYYAWMLTRRAAGDSVESLASTLVDSQVDLKPWHYLLVPHDEMSESKRLTDFLRFEVKAP